MKDWFAVAAALILVALFLFPAPAGASDSATLGESLGFSVQRAKPSVGASKETEKVRAVPKKSQSIAGPKETLKSTETLKKEVVK